jgi:hypothetical protein
MTVKILKDAAKIALPLVVASFALPAFGADVDFTTTGTFACGAAVGCTVSAGGTKILITNHGNTVSIQAIGAVENNVPVNTSPGDNVNVISFDTISTNKPSPSGAVDTSGATFTLNIDQTSPAINPQKGSLGGSFSGTIDDTASSTVITFAPDELVLGGNNEYSLDSATWSIPNPGINQYHESAFSATVTNVTPEPTFMALTGLGFAGLALVAYRRKQTV